MTDENLKSLLAPYAAPTDDMGFSDAVLATLQTEEAATLFDLDSLVKRPTPIWRGWMIAAIIGGLCGLIWTRLGVSVPDLPPALSLESSALGFLSTGWAAYGLAGLCVAVCLLLVEMEVL